MKEYAENKRCESRTIQNSVKKQSIASNVRQNILITDVPESGDFSSVTDLGIWWGMAAEWNHQGNIPRTIPRSNNPHDYIGSIGSYIVRGKSKDINVDNGDKVRMLAHGTPSATLALSNINNPGNVDPEETVENIEKNIENNEDLKHKVLPMFCFIGGKQGLAERHEKLAGSNFDGLGEGPTLCPSNRVVSLNLEKFTNALNSKAFSYDNCSWKDIINKDGSWKSIESVKGAVKEVYNAYCEKVSDSSANMAENNGVLIDLLSKIYNEVNEPYNDFINYLAKQEVLTGEATPLWTIDKKDE